jgi:hypothetical protein
MPPILVSKAPGEFEVCSINPYGTIAKQAASPKHQTIPPHQPTIPASESHRYRDDEPDDTDHAD